MKNPFQLNLRKPPLKQLYRASEGRSFKRTGQIPDKTEIKEETREGPIEVDWIIGGRRLSEEEEAEETEEAGEAEEEEKAEEGIDLFLI